MKTFHPPHLPFPVHVPDCTDDSDVAIRVATTRNAWREAFEAKDLERVMAFYSADIFSYDLMPAEVDGRQKLAFDGEAIWRRNWISFFAMFEDDLKIEIHSLTVFQSGPIATIYGPTRVAGTVNGQKLDMWARETNVLQEHDGRWLLRHDHVSVPMDFATGKALTGLQPD